MGRFVAERRRGKMKTILALALAALAAAELRLMPMPTTATAMALVATTVATDHMVLDTAKASTTARGRLRPSPRLMPITDTEATDLADSTVATGLTVSDMATVSTTTARGRLSPTTVSTLLTTLLPLS